MKVNLCANRFRELTGNWSQMYLHVSNALNSLGHTVYLSPYINWVDKPAFVQIGIKDSTEDIYIYNHCTIQELIDTNFFLGKKTFILKPTAPSPKYFTIDTLGYAAHSSITFQKPDFKKINSNKFFSTTVPNFKANRENKWADREELQFSKEKLDIPENHILVLGQMTGDETVTKMSFGDHWKKLKAIITQLETQDLPLVIKIHPTLKRESLKINDWEYYFTQIKEWQKRHTVLYGFESLHDILPLTKVAIVENTTSGIECLLYDVPIVSYGYPEYHWVTFDLRHLFQLNNAVSDLSWWNKYEARQWLAWYCTEYQCYDYYSTLNRLKKLIEY